MSEPLFEFDPKELAGLKEAMADLLEDADWASELLPDFDYAAQLAAINALIKRNKDAERARSERIDDLKKEASAANGEHANWVEGQWLDAMHFSVYHEAVSSMAALGMIAPFVETLFKRVFVTLGAKQRRAASTARTTLSNDDFWDCRFAWSNREGRREDLALGIWQLADVTGLTSYLPVDLQPRLNSLFSYRNYMFHNGMEWPKDARLRFASRIHSEGWAPHFAMATTDEVPWVIYLSDSGVDWWLSALPELLTGIGRYFRERVRPHS